MKHSAILPMIFLCIPIMLAATEPDTAQTPPPGWNPGGSDSLREWLSQGNSSLLMSARSNRVTIKSDLTWKSVSYVTEDPGCPADPSYSPDWTKVGFNDAGWAGVSPCTYPPHYGIDPTLQTQMIWNPDGQSIAYFRYEFTLDHTVSSAIAALGVDDNFQFYVNGHLVYDDHGYGASVEGPFDITSYLQKGENVFAIRAWDGRYCDIFERFYKAVAFLAEIETGYAPVTCEMTMLNGADFSGGTEITDDPEKLREGGNPVLGVVADGVSRILFRAKVSEPGVVRFSLRGSGEMEEDGILRSIDGIQEGRYVNIGSITMGDDENVFAIYQAPKSFVRAGSSYDDESKAERSLQIEYEFVPNDPAKEPVLLEKEIKVVRPPIILVHGLWGKPDDWYENGFYEMLNEQWPGIYIKIVDYEKTNGKDFSTNKDFVRIAIEEIKTFYASISSLIAIAQVDVVGHSMGGILARLWAGRENDYKRKDNFKQGDIHKLITIDSPHNGSFLADAAIKAVNGPRTRECDNLFREMERRNLSITAGAVYDMQTTSFTINNMNKVDIVPFCHSIIGFYGDVDVYFNPDSSYVWIIGPPEYYTIHTVIQQNGCNLLWDITSSDMVVSCESQQGGLGPLASEQFSHHHMNWQTEPVNGHVIELLNEQTDLHFEQGFPVR